MEKSKNISLDNDSIIRLVGCLMPIVIMAMLTKVYINPQTSIEFISNTFFLVIILLGVYVYLSIMQIVDDFPKFVINNRWKRKKASLKSETQELIVPIEMKEKVGAQEDVSVIVSIEDNEVIGICDIQEQKIKELRENKVKQESLIKEEKLKIAFEYTVEVLAPYVSENDMNILYENIKLYTEKGDFENMKPITVKEVTVKDLKHYGWNLWNHFGIKVNQKNIALFLKKTFEKRMGAIKISSLTGNLPVDGDEGIITIKKSLNEFKKVTID